MLYYYYDTVTRALTYSTCHLTICDTATSAIFEQLLQRIVYNMLRDPFTDFLSARLYQRTIYDMLTHFF